MPGQVVYTREPQFTETLKHGTKTVTTAGTAVPLSSTSAPCIEVLIQVKRTNTGRIYIGGASVPNNDTAGVMLETPIAGSTPPNIAISAQNLNQVYINSTVNGEGVTFLYW